MSDLISRQAAIDAIVAWTVEDRPDIEMPTDLVGRIEALPSAYPERCECCETLSKTQLLIPQPEQRWIPCSERLPKTNGRYIVTRGLKACNAIWNRVYIINYSDLMGLKAEKIWWDGNVGKSDFQKIDDVIAWKPLPEPYKGEQE